MRRIASRYGSERTAPRGAQLALWLSCVGQVAVSKKMRNTVQYQKKKLPRATQSRRRLRRANGQARSLESTAYASSMSSKP